MIDELLELPGRTIHAIQGETRPAVYLVRDRDAGGILINAPEFSEALAQVLEGGGPVRFLFLPSRFGARDLARWRERLNLEVIAYEPEAAAIGSEWVDLPIDHKSKLTRTIDFLPMAGRTPGCCGLRLKNKPGVVFFGPALEPGPDGWPTLVRHGDDDSFETRLFGALGLKDLRFEYAFTDSFQPQQTRYGPGADTAVHERIEQALEAL